jgi:hypothetical protein
LSLVRLQRALNARRDIFDNMRVNLKPCARRAAALLACALLIAGSAGALAVRNPVFGYSIDLPIGWTDSDSSDPYHVGFLSPNSDAMLQVIAMDPATGSSGEEIAAVMFNELGTEGEPAPFAYLGMSAALTDVAFVTAGNEVRGYMVTIDGVQADYVLLAFAVLDSYELAHDHLLSAIDSFAIGDESRVYPGPVSEFFYAFPAAGGRVVQLPFGAGTIPYTRDEQEIDASQVVVEREARILAPYGTLTREMFEAAWRRYFRMIYKDSFMRLAPVADAIRASLEERRVPRVDYPHEVLAWLQGFSFERTGGLSDFRPPVSCLAYGAGDCDSLGLTYVILMHHLGFDAILMVSDRYAHALAAVDVQGPGARFPFEGRQWLVAELTDNVALGQIAADMADPAGWIGIRLRLEAVGE